MRSYDRALCCFSMLFLLVPLSLRSADLQPPAPRELQRTSAEIKIDGDLSDPGWKDALVIDRFYETAPGNNTVPKVKTVAYLTYDGDFFYIGIRADDPDPSRIRAPYVERDQVLGTDDNIAIFLDTRNDKRVAMELRVSPRGIQGDAINNDADGSEDFSPDFFYDTAAKITSAGWQAEFRIPLTTLRYSNNDPQTWGIIVWRNYPREFRYAFQSVPIERGSNCYVCHCQELTGIRSLPSSRHLVVAPFATASQLNHRENPGNPDSARINDDVQGDGGVDVKWNPTANSAIDGTVRPDFSQVEADVPQITANQRFALFYPEKRPFFLEGSDLLNSPIQVVYTRTITDPDWGLRGTGRMGNISYTALAGKDQGGGLVVIPGPEYSLFAPQDYQSTVALGRLRRDFGLSYGSFMMTDREISGGGHNRVFGPDAQWRPTAADAVTGQFVYSNTQDPLSPPFFDGATRNGYAATVSWNHNKTRYNWGLRYKDFSNDFRADMGFVTQVGFREARGVSGLNFYPSGPITFVQPYVALDKFLEADGNRNLGHDYSPGLFLLGSRNLNAQFEFHNNQVKVGDALLIQNYFTYFVQVDPARRFPRITFNGRAGEMVDFENGLVGKGTNISAEVTVRPGVHLTLVADVAREWLDRAGMTRGGRVYTADIERLKAVYVFSSRASLRAIGQYVTTTRNPELYPYLVPKRDGNFLGSLLFSYRLNWQTVFFAGYGDEGVVTAGNSLMGTRRSLFLKLSYAFQR